VKIAVSGKGGVGKTTLTSLLAYTFASMGKKVIAVDADPDANLGLSLGLSLSETRDITPLSEMKDLIEERTGAKSGTVGAIFKMNPKVDDLPDKYSRAITDKIKLFVLGGLKIGGAGCFCPENILLKSMLKHLLVNREEVVLVDMEAGIEHLSRGTTASMDALIIVVNPGKKSIQTGMTVERLAREIGIENIFVVANRVRSKEETETIRQELKGLKFLGSISVDDDISEQDRSGMYSYGQETSAARETREIIDHLSKAIAK
jgi:CO dehydrogenase maturation factor